MQSDMLGSDDGRWVAGLAIVIGLFFAVPGRAAEPFLLARGGKARAAIVAGQGACPASRHMAETLREMLGRMSGATFAIERGDGMSGIAVGTASEFPGLAQDASLPLAQRFGPTDLATRQGYILRSHARGIQIIGASELGVVYAAWDFLYRLGYRYFFPDPAWEIVPVLKDVSLAVDVSEKPDYILRHIAGSVTPDWCLRNRTSPVLGWQNASALPYLPECWTSSLVQSYHNWGAIIGHSKEEFEAHPEYLGLVTVSVPANADMRAPDVSRIDWDALVKGGDGVGPAGKAVPAGQGGDEADPDTPAKGADQESRATRPAPVGQGEEHTVTTQQMRASSKLCVSNPRVRDLATRYVLDYFEKNPEQPSASMEPTDGSGWCECEACAGVGPPSERVALMANTVAEALEKKFPVKYVGILAYHLHADPPIRKLHPRVAVSLATALSGSTPLMERLAGWAKVCGNLGIYEYLSVMEWHLGMPAKSLAGNVPRLAETIPAYHRRNVRFYTGQATAGAWGAHGLGYYLASRLLWNTNDAARVQEIVDDFLRKAFEDAAEPMREYYRVIDGSQAKPGSPAFYLERAKLMYGALREARKATANPAVRERIDRLTLYTRYVELFAIQAGASERDKWPALCRFVRHTYRMRDKGMVGYGIVPGYVKGAREVDLRPALRKTEEDDLLTAEGGTSTTPEKKDCLVDTPFGEAEIQAMLDGTAVMTIPEDEMPSSPFGSTDGVPGK